MEINNPNKRPSHFDPLPETEESARPTQPETRLQPVTIPAHQLRPFLQAGGRIMSLVRKGGVSTLAFKGEMGDKHAWNGGRGPFVLIMTREETMTQALLKTMAEVQQQQQTQKKGGEHDRDGETGDRDSGGGRESAETTQSGLPPSRD